MNLNELRKITEQAETAKREVSQSLASLSPHVQEKLLHYLHAQHLFELAMCATQDDESKIRRCQGAARAYSTIIEVLTPSDVETRRSTSRIEV